MRLRITHSAGYEFDCQRYRIMGEARLQPQFTANQTILATDVNIEPTAWRMDYIDYWGAHVVAFNATDARQGLTLVSKTDLEMHELEESPTETVGWDGLAEHSLGDKLAEFLELDENFVIDPEAQTLREGASTPMDFLQGLGYQGKLMGDDAAINDLIATLRWAGIPTRVVSGYLLPPQLELRIPREATVHGWLQIWDGSWLGWDPRLQQVPGDRHVVMATARQRADIPILTAVHDCDEPSRIHQTVTVERIG